MKRILTALLLVTVLAGSAFGLSDREYLRMKANSRDFRRADQFLNESYAECKDTLPYAQFQSIIQEQRKWLDYGRDEAAEWLMNDGYGRTAAYTKATEMRAHELHQICVRYRNAEYQSSERRYENGNTALILAAVRGNTAEVRRLLRNGADIDARNRWGMTALMYAAERNHAETAEVLINAGAIVNARNNEGCTALIIAAIHGGGEVIDVLLDAGANARFYDNDRMMAVDYARKTLAHTRRGQRVIGRLERVSR